MHDIIKNFTGSTILITGATGFIGSLIAEELLEFNSLYNAGIKLILPVRNIEKASKKYPAGNDKYKEVSLLETSLADIRAEKLDMPIDYIIHCASITTSSVMVSNPVEVADGIVVGTKNILELARIKKIKSMVYLSSMEAYGVIGSDCGLVTENMLGDVDIFSARSCYPLGKRMAEHYCYIYYKQYGVPVKIARLAQVFGYGVDKNDTRVFAQFARAVINNEDIVLHTKGQSIGNYCESKDAINGIFTILERGQNGEAYNVVNEENTMRICDMAKLVAEKIAGGKIRVIYDIKDNSKLEYAKDTFLRMSSEKLRKLGWKPTKNLEDMYNDLIDYLKNQ